MSESAATIEHLCQDYQWRPGRVEACALCLSDAGGDFIPEGNVIPITAARGHSGHGRRALGYGHERTSDGDSAQPSG